MAAINWEKQQQRDVAWRTQRTHHEQMGCGAPRWLMRAKHPGDVCRKCGERIAVGQWIHWGPTEPAVHKFCKRNRLALLRARAAALRR